MLFFLIEATSEIYGPRVYSLSYLPSRSIFILFYFRSISPKTQKYLAALFLYLFYFLYCEIYLSNLLQNKSTFYPGGIASICSLCVGTVYVVLHGSPTGSITLVSSLGEIPTVAVLHHTFLFGEILT